jgi:hypothetical protein
MKPLAISILMLGTLMFFALTAHASEAPSFIPALLLRI